MRWVRWGIYALLITGAAAVLILAFRPQPVTVDLAEAVRGRFEQTVDDDGKTRVRERYTVSAPLAGTLLRIRLKAGDPVAVGAVLASIVPNPSPLLEPRTRQELEQRLGAAEARKLRATAAVARAQANLAQAQTDLSRSRALAPKGVIPASKLEHDEIMARIATRELDAARFEDHAAEHEVELARAALDRPAANGEKRGAVDGVWDIRSPVAGSVLRVFQESEASVGIGVPLIEIGDPRDMEVVVDVLSADAVQIEPGFPARLENWGGEKPLQGRVRRIEPSAFTKVSALGVEEQRTNVLIDIVSPDAEWTALGDGYRVDARIVVYEADNVLTIPTGALFRDGDQWAVYVEAGGMARKRIMTVLRRSALEAVVSAGLNAGDRVILFPSDAIRDGIRVVSR